jgi:hypothetical protein
MKEGDDDMWCSAQERSNILDNAMGVLGLVDGQKNSHGNLLGGARSNDAATYSLSPLSSPIPRGCQGKPRPIFQKQTRRNVKFGKAAGR